jgi:hypothetical protein
MLLIPGIIGSAAPQVGDFESIATVSGTGSNSSVTFSGISTDFQHLQIRWISKSTNTGSFNWLTFNSDTAANYANHYLYGDGSSAIAGADINQSRINLYGSSVTSSQANTFAIHVIDILDYRNTNKFKTVRALGGQDSNGSGVAFLSSGLWRSTSAITSITVTANADNFNANSRFYLYGIKG